MGLKIEKLEGNMALLTIDVAAEEFEKAMQNSYKKNREKISIQGFRKGKAPRQLIEKLYGEGVFYEDAANELIEGTYFRELEASEEGKALEIVSRPEIDVKEIGTGKTFVYTAKVALKPEVKLGKYKGFEVEKKTAEVTEEEIGEELKRVQEQNSRTITVEDRAVQEGDTATIDYEGFCDGVAFAGGKGEDYDLTIGSHSFIAGFEDQIIGHNTGDAFDVNVTFPTEYHSEELAGKDATFKVAVKGIKAKELPELDDEFASEISDFETFAEYKEDLVKKLTERKQTGLDNERKEELLRKAVENAEMVIPEAMVKMRAEQMVNEYAQNLQMQGLSIDMFMKYTGQTVESMVEQYKEQAKKQIEGSLVLEAIAKEEKIEVAEEDVEEELKKMAAMYQMELDKVKELISDTEKENMKKDLAIRKAMDFLAE